ncbi:GTPase-activator protein for ras-like GTPase containing protein [Paraphaeosphaeria sporulosa]
MRVRSLSLLALRLHPPAAPPAPSRAPVAATIRPTTYCVLTKRPALLHPPADTNSHRAPLNALVLTEQQHPTPIARNTQHSTTQAHSLCCPRPACLVRLNPRARLRLPATTPAHLPPPASQPAPATLLNLVPKDPDASRWSDCPGILARPRPLTAPRPHSKKTRRTAANEPLGRGQGDTHRDARRVARTTAFLYHTPGRACPDKLLARRPRALTMAVSMLHAPSRASTSSSSSFIPVSRQNTMSSHDGSRSVRQSKRYSVTALYLSMSAKDKDLEIEDDLAKAQKILRELKSKISSQSKKNFVLEKDVRYLDSRIALLIQNRMALEEQNEVANHLDDATELQEGFFPNDQKTQQYGNLLFLLQSEPRHIAHLCRLVSMAEIDALLQTVMFTIYGNQYESREEHLLLTMFQSVLTYQFDNTPDYSSLLRANTPVSRMMTTYTRRGPGQSYLKVVLQDSINSLIELKDLDLEINPLKVYEKMVTEIEDQQGTLPPNLPKGVTAEQAAENETVQQIIAPRLTMLMEIANNFLTTIINGLEETPYGIRWICKQIRSLSKRKYPDAQDQTICTLIGGFFFLRFINPAIVTPRSYMLIDATPAENPKRTLTYIAKMLQNLANKPSYAKEPYMVKLQPFIQLNKERINKFLLDLCEVQDFYDTLEMDNYVALSKRDLELSITLNEVYATHSLLERHAGELSKDDSSHLGVILGELGPAPAQLPRKENRAINLPLFSKWETPIDDLTAALDITQEEIFFMEAKSTFVMILRSLPPNSSITRRPLRLDRIAEAAATTKNDSVMVKKGIRSMELLSQLQELGVVDKEDGFSLLRDEVEQELVHLGSMKEKVIEETRKLEEVFRTIRDHNAYLVGQLETYKSYLHNVRSQSEGKTRKQQKHQVLGPYKFTHQQLEKEGVIQKSNVPENRRANIYFNFTSPLPGTFVISLHYKGRNRGLLELDLKLDDLLEMQKDNQEDLDLEYVQFNVSKVLVLLNKRFARKKGW